MDQWRPPELNLRILADEEYKQYAQKTQRVFNGVKIDTNVPIPPEVVPKKRILKYPFAELNLGESFFIPDLPYKRMTPLARYWSRKLNRQFIVRKVDGGVRVWRRG